MKVLFVSSNKSGEVSVITKSQGISLEKKGIQIQYFLINGKGIKGYLASIIPFKKGIKEFKPDIIHAHYSHCGFFSALFLAKPLVVSLMGSDVNRNIISIYLLKVFQKLFWEKTIVKTRGMSKRIEEELAEVIPNGINIELFRPISQKKCLEALNWDRNKKHILFAADPEIHVKNFKLFHASLISYQQYFSNIEYHTLVNVDHESVPIYMNAAEVVCLSSLSEGSPNVIKEAMACNRPVVCTNVGDVQWLFGNTEGCFISESQTPESYKNKLNKALEYSKISQESKGRKRIMELGLDSDTVANKIINIYQCVI